MTLEQLIAKRGKLEEHIFSGKRRVRFEDSEVEYRTVAEMQSALAQLNSQIASLQGLQQQRIFNLKTSRGI